MCLIDLTCLPRRFSGVSMSWHFIGVTGHLLYWQLTLLVKYNIGSAGVRSVFPQTQGLRLCYQVKVWPQTYTQYKTTYVVLWLYIPDENNWDTFTKFRKQHEVMIYKTWKKRYLIENSTKTIDQILNYKLKNYKHLGAFWIWVSNEFPLPWLTWNTISSSGLLCRV